MKPLPDDLVYDFLVPLDHWAERKVPKPVQAHVLEDEARALLLGEHPEHGYFFAELMQGGRIVFREWWVDVQDESLAAWASKLTTDQLAKAFLANGFAVALMRAGEESSKKNIFERIQTAITDEAKRRNTEPS